MVKCCLQTCSTANNNYSRCGSAAGGRAGAQTRAAVSVTDEIGTPDAQLEHQMTCLDECNMN